MQHEIVTCRNITLDTATQAIRAYNAGCYRGKQNPDLDKEARQKFAGGLASSEVDIRDQVRFIGKDYGGVAGFPVAIELAPQIARDIYSARERYVEIAKRAVPLLQAPSRLEVVTELYLPFVKLYRRKRNWQVWGAKFWHFLNPDAFPVEDSRVDKFFQVTESNSPHKYVSAMQRLREFALTHQSWLPTLRAADGGLAWCDNKIWDKICYGLGEFQKCKRS